MHQIAPDTTKRSDVTPTHWHCYKWSGGGHHYADLGKKDTLDIASPDRPPVRTVDWLRKSPRLIDAVHTTPAAARDWLIGEWEKACANPLHPVPGWVSTERRAHDALHAIETGCWPSWSQWIAGGSIVLMAVVGTPESCH